MRIIFHGLVVACSLTAFGAMSGCTAVSQVEFDIETTDLSLGAGDLKKGGIGFLTPAAATGQEADKQALAQSFSKQLKQMRPDIDVVSLPRMLSAVNAADLEQEYKEMYRDYLETSILEGSTLQKIGVVGDVRFLAQLSLSGFEQQSNRRFGLFGLRLIDTKQANMRVFIQIWDVETGAVAWEGGTELNYAYESSVENPVTFLDVAKLAAERLFAQLPELERKKS
jgi:hypothetical protein